MQKHLYEHGVILKESKIHLKSDREKAIWEAVKEIKHHRKELVDYLRRHPNFQYSLKPLKVSSRAPEIIKSMANSAQKAGVGPMAAVAGTFADYGMKAMLRTEAKIAVVEDGGEIAATTNETLLVSLFSSYAEISGKIGFFIAEKDTPLGIATSSSKTGHVLSFGKADSVTVIADNASLADAAATAICNFVVDEDVKESVQRGLERAKEIEGVRGVLIVRDGQIGLWGKLPKILSIK